MTQLAAKGPKTRVGLAASLVLHLALVTAAALSLPHWRQPPERRSVVVTLLPQLQTLQPAPRSRPPVRSRESPLSTPPPSPPLPAAIAAPSAPTAPGLPPPAPAPAEIGANVRALLRGSAGCAPTRLVRLSQEEQDRCARLFKTHTDPSLVIPAPIEAHKRAWFDATVAARNAPDHGPGGGCFGKPAHGIKLGPLPCYIELPKGPFTEDVDVPPEPEH